jgi:hypothetical protein
MKKKQTSHSGKKCYNHCEARSDNPIDNDGSYQKVLEIHDHTMGKSNANCTMVFDW